MNLLPIKALKEHGVWKCFRSDGYHKNKDFQCSSFCPSINFSTSVRRKDA